MAARVQLEGFSELARMLDQLPNDVARRFAVTAARAGTRHLQKRAAQVVPKGREPSRKSRRNKGTKGKPGKQVFYDFGRWQDNLKIRRDKKVEGAAEVAFRMTSGDAFWSFFYEMGTKTQPARPTIRPMFFAETDNVIGIMAESLNRSIIRRQGRLAAAA